ncbi:hypothetical protein BD560DRAFT_491163 [Blakeslea trispora]|nr:hypothetical protein BD560DRAFT_491163 [Blakeslea trispora]
MITSLQAVSLSVALSSSPNLDFADAIGYSMTTGVLDEERIMIKCSSDGSEENLQHTYDNSLKLIKSLTTMLVLKAYRCPYTSFKAFLNFKTIGIQCVKRTLTLFVLYMNEELKLLVEEKSCATIPICFDEVFELMQIFKLELVIEQEQVDKMLRSEHAVVTDIGSQEIVSEAFEDSELVSQLGIEDHRLVKSLETSNTTLEDNFENQIHNNT